MTLESWLKSCNWSGYEPQPGDFEMRSRCSLTSFYIIATVESFPFSCDCLPQLCKGCDSNQSMVYILSTSGMPPQSLDTFHLWQQVDMLLASWMYKLENALLYSREILCPLHIIVELRLRNPDYLTLTLLMTISIFNIQCLVNKSSIHVLKAEWDQGYSHGWFKKHKNKLLLQIGFVSLHYGCLSTGRNSVLNI